MVLVHCLYQSYKLIHGPTLSNGFILFCDLQEAVRNLNTLQTNAAVLERIRREKGRRAKNNLPMVIDFAKRIGLTVSTNVQVYIERLKEDF